jgi:hypothetical protein
VNGRRECMKYETFRRKVKELSGRTDKTVLQCMEVARYVVR